MKSKSSGESSMTTGWRARIGVFMVLVMTTISAHAEVFLPGSQPKEHKFNTAKVRSCRLCHNKSGNGDSEPYSSWEGGMMSQSARDPVFRAALAVANQDIEGVGEYCLRCHTPSAWLEGRSSKSDGSSLTDNDMHGVTCQACHRLVDPATDEARALAKDVPPGQGNAMMVADPENIMRGPYADSPKVSKHGTKHSPFHASSRLCGTCHDVSNPLAATDIRKQPPYTYGTIERTFSEWSLSDFAKPGEGHRSCQSCHYPAVEGGGKAGLGSSSPHRAHFVEHGPVGASTWVQDAVLDIWGKDAVNVKALARGKAKTAALLKTSARLEWTFPEKGSAVLRIVNLSGHKLPTGYLEGRRMWANVRFVDAAGEVVKEQGRYAEVDAVLKGEPVRVKTLVDADTTRVYECMAAMSEAQAKRHSKKPGKSFHFVLNDVIAKDNRIPPKGFMNEAFQQRNCQPVDAVYADGQHWDDQRYDVPDGAVRVEASLLFESVSWEYLKFLVEQNRTDDWGNKLYDSWNRTGQCPPSVLSEAAQDIPR